MSFRSRPLLAAAFLVLTLSAARAAEGPEAAIREVVAAGTHPGLRWPSFPDYQSHVWRLYEAGAYAPVWTRDGRPTAQATATIAALLDAGARGLDPRSYDAEQLRADAERLGARDGSPRDLGFFDTALTIATMRYVSDAYIGRVNPRNVGLGLDVEPKKLDLAMEVFALTRSDDPRQRLAALDPPFALFGRLATALAATRALAARTDLPPIPPLPKLRPGDRYGGVPALRARLLALGDLSDASAVPTDPHRYDPALVEAVKRFQERHGRTRDGVIGSTTQSDLAVPLAQRVTQIELAMERLRWLPPGFGGRFIVVNLPEFRLRGFETGQRAPAVSMEVVVGSAASGTETPVMHADMQYVVFRPYWLVPPDIARKEILPREARDPGHLAKQGMEVVDGRVRQRPGPQNALGLVKFILPNAYHVYLHDTPSKGLFARSRRDFSHGCIRVADPTALAEWVLRDGWDHARIREAMTRGSDNHRVNLPEPVPVYLFYTTIVVELDGRIFFFDDIYGHDATLARALAKGYPYPA